MSNKELISISKDTNVLLNKSKDLLDITKNILSKKDNIDWIQILLKWFEDNIIQEKTLYPKTKTELLEARLISLKWNRLKDIPSEFMNLQKLESLELNNNTIETLPEGIENLISLKHLNLNINCLKTLPRGIIKLNKLEYLNIKNNKYFTRFDITRIKYYYKFYNKKQDKKESLLIDNFLKYAKKFRKEFYLETGDILIHNNKTTLHDRTECSLELNLDGLLSTREIFVSFVR